MAMKHRVTAVATGLAIAAVALTGAGCGSSKKKEAHGAATSAATATASSSSTTSATTSASASVAPPTSRHAGKPKQVAVMSSQYGDIINAPGGHALYVFTRDQRGQGSTCYDACARKWPPFLVRRAPVARNAVQQRLLGTLRRRDGRIQATYSGRPLYFYVGERDPGEVLCQGVNEFGGTWLVVAPGGKPVPKR